MQIKQSTEYSLTVEELKNLILTHLKVSKGAKVFFDIDLETDPDDIFAEYKPVPMLKRVRVSV